MAEYDAFGRKIGDDTAAVPTAAPTPTPAPMPTPVVPTAAPTPTPTPTRVPTPVPTAPPTVSGSSLRVVGASAGSGGSLWPVVLGIVIISVVAGGIFFAVQQATNTVNSVRKGLESFAPATPQASTPSAPATPAPPAAPAAPPAGLTGQSLIRVGAMTSALDKLHRSGLGKMTNLRVAADRIDVQLVTHDGRLRDVQIEPGGELRKLSVSGSGFGFVPTIPFADIDAAAPARLAAAASRRHGASPRKIDYLVASRFDGRIVWIVFFKDGAHYQGDASGRLT